MTLAGTGWALMRSGISLSDLRALQFLSMRTSVSIILILIILYLSDVWRYQVLGWAVGQPGAGAYSPQ